jgi:cullin 3
LERNAYTLVLHKYGDLLYDGVKQTIQENLTEVHKTVMAAQNESLLETLVAVWERHRLIMTMIRDVLMYLDKTHCARMKLTVVYDMGLELFRDVVLKQNNINNRLRKVLLDNIAKERQNETIDRILMKSALSMLVEVNVNSKLVYQEDFETPFLAETKLFYETEVQYFLSNNTVPDYMRKVEAHIWMSLPRESF